MQTEPTFSGDGNVADPGSRHLQNFGHVLLRDKESSIYIYCIHSKIVFHLHSQNDLNQFVSGAILSKTTANNGASFRGNKHKIVIIIVILFPLTTVDHSPDHKE